MLSESAARALIEWTPVSPRIITARLNSKSKKVAIISCYAPTNTAADDQKEKINSSLQDVLDHTPRRLISKLFWVTSNAKIGPDHTGKERVMRGHG